MRPSAFAGEPAALEYSVHYAAPEVIRAAADGWETMVASGALDMWSLGVIAVELLTCSRIFPPPMTEDDVRAQLLGEKPLPWEDPELKKDLLPKLKVLKRSVLKCLERDPGHRPASQELLGAWHGLFESMTGTTTAAYVVPVPKARPEGEILGEEMKDLQ
jgi:serine/threonine protein kinase